MKENFTIIALGSNLGDRLTNLKAGFNLLKEKIRVTGTSYIYASNALLPASAPAEWDREYYNCVFYGSTGLNSSELLDFSKAVENKIGTRENRLWSPRKLDIDIIAYNNDVIDTEKLKIPHGMMHERAFVVIPLYEILPGWVHPVLNETAEELAGKCSRKGLINTELRL